MNKINLTSSAQLEDLFNYSKLSPVVIFKHSTRCSISSMALNRVEREWDLDSVRFYYLDLLQHRNLSNEIAELFEIKHESPQLIALENGSSIYSASHNAISVEELKKILHHN